MLQFWSIPPLTTNPLNSFSSGVQSAMFGVLYCAVIATLVFVLSCLLLFHVVPALSMYMFAQFAQYVVVPSVPHLAMAWNAISSSM